MKAPTRHAIILLLFFAACQQQPASSVHAKGISKNVIADITTGGSYSGHYSKGLLTLAINYISGKTVSGYDVHKGLRRNLNGTVDQKGGQLEFVLKEPGGNPYDGTFYLSLDTATNKISGKWVPTDASLAKAGPLELARSFEADPEITDGEWESNLGSLNFLDQGVCTLEYYPGQDSLGNVDPNAQLVTVRGSFEIRGDTVRIDWQRNSRTPALNMKLVRRPGIEGTDSTETVPPSLEGNGVKFDKNMGG